MSIVVMSWVWQHSQATNGARITLLAIADNANEDDGSGAWPSIETLCRKTNLSERSVHRAITELVEIGELEVTEGGGRGRTNGYRVLMKGCQDDTLTDRKPSQDGTLSVVKGANMSEKPSHNGTQNRTEPKREVVQTPDDHALEAIFVADPELGWVEACRPVPRKDKTRGTRLPADWYPTREMYSWAEREFPDLDLDDQTARFRDYWLAKAGAGARHVDWGRTWANWLRRARDYMPRSRLAAVEPRWD